MNKIRCNLMGVVAALLILGPAAIQAQTPVDAWGFIGGRTAGWNFVPGATPGNAGVAGDDFLNGTWSAIRGGFVQPVTATLDQAVVVTGKVEFIGAGPSTWSGLRYGLFQHDSIGVLENAGTDSAAWSGSEAFAYGYMFTPHSGVNDQVGWANGGNGTQGVVRGGSWISSFGGGTALSLGVVDQLPPRAEFDEGTYDFAISVQPQPDGTKELRFYMIKQGNPTTYWYGGTVTDTTSIAPTFNGVCFALNGGNGAENSPIRGMNLIDVQVSQGDPIEVPPPPPFDFYVGNWGFIGGRVGGWRVTSGPVIGNASIGGDAAPVDWSAVRGAFPVTIEATQGQAIKVTGKMEFVNAGFTGWSTLRYGLFHHDSTGALLNAGTDSAAWEGSEGFARGYMFTPHSGVNDQVGWANGGNGTQGVVRGGSWISSFGGGTALAMGVNDQLPPRAEGTAGIYNFGIWVQPQGDGTNQVSFYLVKEDNSYWYGGTRIDTTGIMSTFNGVCFSVRSDNGDPDFRALNLVDVFVEVTDQPLEIPPTPPFSFFQPTEGWGILGGRTSGWTLTPGPVIGNASLAGNAPPTDWVTVRAGFGVSIAPVDTPLVVKGVLEFDGGGFTSESSLRLGVFHSDSAGVVANAGTDSAAWTGSEDDHSGYLFIPRSGTNTQPVWTASGEEGSFGAVVDGLWFSTEGAGNYALGNVFQVPENVVGAPGIYNFEFSFKQLPNGSMNVKFNFFNEDSSYVFSGVKVDDHAPLATTRFNSINFAVNTNPGMTAMHIRDLLIGALPTVDPIVAIEPEPGAAIPQKYALEQNYPNPFNPSTTIKFSLPQSGDIQLVVYDLTGRVVAELVNERLSAGEYKINFDAVNLASGVYFYRLKAGDFVSVKKLVLLK